MKEREWVIVVNQLEDFERALQVIPFLKLGSQVSDHPSCACNGEWENADELLQVLYQNSVDVVSVQERQG